MVERNREVVFFEWAEIVSDLNGLLVDVYSQGRGNGNKVHMYVRNRSLAQKWRLTREGILETSFSGTVIDIGLAGGGVHMWSKHGGHNQIWRFTPEGYLENPHTGRVLEIINGNRNQGATLRAAQKLGGINQKWSFIPWEPRATAFRQ